jgi:hypothetical protein
MRDYVMAVVIAMILTAHVIIVVWFIKELGFRNSAMDIMQNMQTDSPTPAVTKK